MENNTEFEDSSGKNSQNREMPLTILVPHPRGQYAN